MRRTKEDSEQTRRRILAAARGVFARQGVTRTTMEEIARAAGVTRGAVYWHFQDKVELFFAMRDQVSLPLIDRIDFALLRDEESDPLAGVERFLLGIIEALQSDPVMRQTFRIMSFKCEYVAEFERELAHFSGACAELVAKLARAYRRAARIGLLRAGLKPEDAALETCSFLIGLVRMWLMDRSGRLARAAAARSIAAHVAGRRRARS